MSFIENLRIYCWNVKFSVVQVHRCQVSCDYTILPNLDIIESDRYKEVECLKCRQVSVHIEDYKNQKSLLCEIADYKGKTSYGLNSWNTCSGVYITAPPPFASVNRKGMECISQKRNSGEIIVLHARVALNFDWLTVDNLLNWRSFRKREYRLPSGWTSHKTQVLLLTMIKLVWWFYCERHSGLFGGRLCCPSSASKNVGFNRSMLDICFSSIHDHRRN